MIFFKLQWKDFLSMNRRFSIFASLLFVVAAANAQTPQRVIIDTDPGVDDAMAILLALNSPELKVEALTVVPGNVEGSRAWRTR